MVPEIPELRGEKGGQQPNVIEVYIVNNMNMISIISMLAEENKYRNRGRIYSGIEDGIYSKRVAYVKGHDEDLSNRRRLEKENRQDNRW